MLQNVCVHKVCSLLEFPGDIPAKTATGPHLRQGEQVPRVEESSSWWANKLGVAIFIVIFIAIKIAKGREKEQQEALGILFFMFTFRGNHGFVSFCYVSTVRS